MSKKTPESSIMNSSFYIEISEGIEENVEKEKEKEKSPIDIENEELEKQILLITSQTIKHNQILDHIFTNEI